jgi:hypothetical protein
MTLGRKDVAATALTALVVTFFATHEGWNVPFVGDSHRWAATGIAILGVLACAQGTSSRDRAARLFAGLGAISGLLAIGAIVTGSLTLLSLLVVAIVLLWAASTARHMQHGSGTPTTA